MGAIPEIEVTEMKGGRILAAYCKDPDCEWYQFDLVQDREDFENAVSYHKQWHEDGMPE